MATDKYEPFNNEQGLKIREMINGRIWAAVVGFALIVTALGTFGFFGLVRPAIVQVSSDVATSEFVAAVAEQVTASPAFSNAVQSNLDTRANNAVATSITSAASGLMGMIAIFGENGCPTDGSWQAYDAAQGRVVVGVGEGTDSMGLRALFTFGHADVPVTGVLQVVVDPSAESPETINVDINEVLTGGDYVTRLNPDEMPRHQHEIENIYVQEGQRGPSEGERAWSIQPRRNELTSWAGDNQPHNNMPPYIALHFCEYVGVGE